MSTDAPAGGDTTIRDRYELQSLLGHGGMGMVWSAHDRRLDRTVALKLLRPDVPESTANRMEREARAAARIDDRRIVTVLDLDHMEDGRPFLVMELHDGWTLADELAQGPLPTARFQRLTEDLLGGLASAHACGVMHRDIKPANVLAETDRFRITDFGLASIDTDDQTDPDLMGTLAYIAPERLQGTSGTATADVFSAAVVLYEAATGHKPFRADTPAEAIMAVRARRVPPLPDHVPAEVARTILLALDPDPQRRPEDAGEFLASAYGVEPPTRADIDATQQLEETGPIQHVDPEGDPERTTVEMLRPRSGTTRTLPSLAEQQPPKPEPNGHPPSPTRDADDHQPFWRQRPDLVMFAVAVLTLAFLLGAIVSGGDGATADAPAGETPTTQVETGGPGPAGPGPDQTGPGQTGPVERLDETLSRIEDLGR